MSEPEDDRARHLINVAAEAAKAGSRGDARGLLHRALATGPSVGVRIRAWRALADLTDDAAEKRECLGNILLADPTDGLARRDLAVLDGTLNPLDIVDPNRGVSDSHQVGVASASALGQSATSRGQKFTPITCATCGAGQLAYSPEVGALVCTHCGTTRPLTEPPPGNEHSEALAGDDFAVAMWSAKGRRAPTAQQILACSHCGAGFVVKPGVLSTPCFYCGATAAIRQSEAHDLLVPDAILPLAITREQAIQMLEAVVEDDVARGHDLSGGYVPVWLLTFGGDVGWTGVARQPSGDVDGHRETVNGTYTVIELVVPVFGTSRLHGRAEVGPPQIDVSRAVPFNEEYLAGFPAESYDITLEQAAVAARPVAIDRTREEVVESTIDEAVRVEIATGGLGVETFKLLLAPIWIAPASGDRPPLVLDGCTGQVYSRSGGGFLDRLRRSLGIE